MDVTIVKFPSGLLERFRPLQQALADLVAKHDGMHLNHPERRDLARMISLLQAEIACRGEGIAAG